MDILAEQRQVAKVSAIQANEEGGFEALSNGLETAGNMHPGNVPGGLRRERAGDDDTGDNRPGGDRLAGCG